MLPTTKMKMKRNFNCDKLRQNFYNEEFKLSICKTAIINPDAKIGHNVTINPFCVIGDCSIGDNSVIHSHVYIGDNIVIEEGVEIFNGAVIGKVPKGAGSSSRPIEYNKSIKIGNNSSICPHSIIYYDVIIGNKTLIADCASVREGCRIGDNCIISRHVSLNYNVIVGNNVKIMDGTHITGNTVIEDNVFISVHVGSANDNKITAGYGDHVMGQIIKENAIVGLGANLLPGIEIGYGAQVGAGALVTRDVGDRQLVKGIPAKAVQDKIPANV